MSKDKKKDYHHLEIVIKLPILRPELFDFLIVHGWLVGLFFFGMVLLIKFKLAEIQWIVKKYIVIIAINEIKLHWDLVF